MEIIELHHLVRGFFGAKATLLGMSPANMSVSCVLYESFHFSCNVNDRHGAFIAGILLPGGSYVTEFLGERVSREPDEESIKGSLAQVEAWCRLQLTDKFLEAYEGAGLPEKLAARVQDQRMSVARRRQKLAAGSDEVVPETE